MLGPYNLCGGKNLTWDSREEEAFIDLLALQEKPRTETSSGYDIIIVTKNIFPKAEKRPKAMIFMASMCRMTSPGAIFNMNNDIQQIDDTYPGRKKELVCKTFPLTCVVQKAQSRSGVFVIEEVYGLEAVIRKQAKQNQVQGDTINESTHAVTTTSTPTNDDDNTDTTGDCVICLSDARSVALYPCRHWCVCMACAEALPSQQNTCPVCRQPFYLLLE